LPRALARNAYCHGQPGYRLSGQIFAAARGLQHGCRPGHARALRQCVMRFAWVAPLITNWMGDYGDLVRLSVTVRRPGLYGDLVTYSGKVTGKDEARGTVTVDIAGTKQDGIVTTGGQAE